MTDCPEDLAAPAVRFAVLATKQAREFLDDCRVVEELADELRGAHACDSPPIAEAWADVADALDDVAASSRRRAGALFRLAAAWSRLARAASL